MTYMGLDLLQSTHAVHCLSGWCLEKCTFLLVFLFSMYSGPGPYICRCLEIQGNRNVIIQVSIYYFHIAECQGKDVEECCEKPTQYTPMLYRMLIVFTGPKKQFQTLDSRLYDEY